MSLRFVIAPFANLDDLDLSDWHSTFRKS